jgi:N-acyl-L-homoserine lactone synthetase
MNVIALSQRQFGLNLDLLAAMFRLRRRVFRDRLDWTVSVTMLADTVPQLLAGLRPPRSNRILESSRFCIDTRLAAQPAGNGLNRATFMLFAAMIESLGLLEADSIVTVTDTRMERILRRAGWPLERLAPPQRIDQTMALAGFLHGSRETLSSMYRQAGVEGPVLSQPEAIQSAA